MRLNWFLNISSAKWPICMQLSQMKSECPKTLTDDSIRPMIHNLRTPPRFGPRWAHKSWYFLYGFSQLISVRNSRVAFGYYSVYYAISVMTTFMSLIKYFWHLERFWKSYSDILDKLLTFCIFLIYDFGIHESCVMHDPGMCDLCLESNNLAFCYFLFCRVPGRLYYYACVWYWPLDPRPRRVRHWPLDPWPR